MNCASKRKRFSWRTPVVVMLVTLLASFGSTSWAVVIMDGFGDADRNNDSSIGFYDTDVNLSDTLNDVTGDPNNEGKDEDLFNKGLIEVTAAEDAGDVGIKWSASRGFTSSNTGDPKANIKIINDDVATGVETQGQLHNNGLALGYEAKGTGSLMMGNFGQSVVLGPDVGNLIRVKIDMRFWQESANPVGAANPGDIRWGIFQDTDSELGMITDAGQADPNTGVQAMIEFGAEDGDWRGNEPGHEGDKGIWTQVDTGPAGNPNDARIKYEYNLKNINGTSNNGRILEGSGVSNTPGSGGDVGSVAQGGGSDGPGGIIASFGPHEIRMDLIRVDDPADPNNTLIQVASFIDGVEIMRDEIKPTDTGASVLQPAPESFDYIVFKNNSGDVDFVFDNFMIASLVPEPTSMLLLSLGGLVVWGRNRRR